MVNEQIAIFVAATNVAICLKAQYLLTGFGINFWKKSKKFWQFFLRFWGK